MEFLLKNPTMLKQVARAFPAMEAIMFQINLDVATPENAANIGHDILALKRVRDIFEMFAMGGQVLLNKEEKQNK
jgi:hypothetical protein